MIMEVEHQFDILRVWPKVFLHFIFFNLMSPPMPQTTTPWRESVCGGERKRGRGRKCLTTVLFWRGVAVYLPRLQLLPKKELKVQNKIRVQKARCRFAQHWQTAKSVPRLTGAFVFFALQWPKREANIVTKLALPSSGKTLRTTEFL